MEARDDAFSITRLSAFVLILFTRVRSVSTDYSFQPLSNGLFLLICVGIVSLRLEPQSTS